MMGVYRPPKATRAEKIKWLLAHQDMWEGWQAPTCMRGDSRAFEIIKAMRADGLISKSTYWLDVRLNNLIQDARVWSELPKTLAYAQ